jgi:hypothetical protein
MWIAPSIVRLIPLDFGTRHASTAPDMDAARFLVSLNKYGAA